MIRLHPLVSYFVLAYSIAWLSGLAVASPYWMRGESVPKMAGLMMFPAMLLGPSVAGLLCTYVLEGGAGVRSVIARMWRIGSPRWLAAVAIPPATVMAVLAGLRAFFIACFCAESLLGRLLFWRGGRIVRRDRLDRLRISPDAISTRRLQGGDVIGTALGGMASSGDRLPGKRDAPWQIFAGLFPGVHNCYDRDARLDLLGLCQHRQPAPGSNASREFDRGSGCIGSVWRERESRGPMVRGLRRGFMVNCRAHTSIALPQLLTNVANGVC